MVLLDANIFLYAWGRDHPLQSACRAILRGVGTGNVEATTSVEVVQEVVYVLHRRGRTEDAVKAARALGELFPGVLPITSAELRVMCDLLEEYPDLPPRDALHAATVQLHDLAGIVSADRHFDRVEGLTRMDPASF